MQECHRLLMEKAGDRMEEVTLKAVSTVYYIQRYTIYVSIEEDQCKRSSAQVGSAVSRKFDQFQDNQVFEISKFKLFGIDCENFRGSSCLMQLSFRSNFSANQFPRPPGEASMTAIRN